ncbi:hypothetical protein [Cellulomonas wangsupingiae]|uniref:Uncharacterized protein n=1 Tax=Cellulomonas wangsupingiae TaxID=2968085 RepID=A0ABY5K0F7_9CELL|nr:hypothetical protein [Cellulomonas wangsupingiae]MCC2333307.1 hypothetical protein [Cellulomonas wangsupingiae]UUI63510.1 hypothetical protein NP075_10055 [Cellulomonas wangsupingiae]
MIVDGHEGTVRRPSMLGALVYKAAAYGVVLDRARLRHLPDFVVLATLVRPDDELGSASKRDREHLSHALGELIRHPEQVAAVEGGDLGVERVRTALGLRPARAQSDKTPAQLAASDPFAPRRRPRGTR